METQERSVIISTIAETDIQNIYLYGVETFGKNAAETFKAELLFVAGHSLPSGRIPGRET